MRPQDVLGRQSIGYEQEVDAATRRWYAVRLLPRQEAAAEANLIRQKLHVFVPKVMKTTRHARKLLTRKVPLFPLYGFVELNLAVDRWRSVNGTFGVATLVMARERPLPAPVGLVEEFLAHADPDGIIDLARGLEVGAEVRLRTGPFAGALGTLVDLDDKGRVEVLLRIMNGLVRVKAAQNMLEVVRGERA